jgi:predicted small integral membrane protein
MKNYEAFYFFVQSLMVMWTIYPAERNVYLVHEAQKRQRYENYILVLIEVL